MFQLIQSLYLNGNMSEAAMQEHQTAKNGDMSDFPNLPSAPGPSIRRNEKDSLPSPSLPSQTLVLTSVALLRSRLLHNNVLVHP